MNWIKYQLHTTTKYANIIGDILCDIGINGYEITDHVPLNAKEEKQMYTDIPADMGFDDGSSILTFYTEAPGNKNSTFFSTGSSLRDAKANDAKANDAKANNALANDALASHALAENPKKIYTPGEIIEKIQSHIAAMQEFIPVPDPVITYSVEDDTDWKDKWKENFKPFRIADNIIVKPTWEDVPSDVSKDDIILQIDPGSAFGTGTHETTKLCLLSLRKYITPQSDILDAGCGSGILAISALLCGARSSFCLDIDPAAVSATLENARINNINPGRIKAFKANILEDTSIITKNHKGLFDIAVANILADVIVLLADHIGSYIKDGGLFISSGILAQKAFEVEEALVNNHFQVLDKNTLGEWVSFTALKPGK